MTSVAKNKQLTISLPPDGQWMVLAQNALHDYCRIAGFSEKLTEMCANSAMEACEELVRLSAEAGVDEPFDLILDSRGETVVIDIAYSGRIPLNPQKAEDYEIPDEGTGLDDVNLDTLWLHIIKKRMDRVRFMVQGARHVLRIIKYRREEGKERQAWIMAVKPELRGDLLLHLDDKDAEQPGGTLQARGTGAIRLGPSEAFFVRNMDGKRSFHDLYMSHIDVLGLISPGTLVQLYEKLESMNMLVDHSRKRAGSPIKRVLGRIVNPDFSIPNADAVVTSVHRKAQFLCSQWGVGLLILTGLSGLVPALMHHGRLLEVVANLEVVVTESPWVLLPFYGLTIIHIALHELGHGVACKHFGGLVPRLGVMFYLASFIFYCDTTAAWSFARKRDRILVSLAGPLMTFAVLGASLWAAGALAGSGGPWESILVAFCLSNLFILAMNFNPFIKMDAYYMLLDYTGIANLRERSFSHLKHRLLNWLGAGSREKIQCTLFERRIFIWYGVLGGVVTMLFFALPLYRLNLLLTAESVTGGRLLLAVVVTALLVFRLGRLAYSKIRNVRYREYSL